MATIKKRSKLPKSDFAVPSKRKFPIPDISHARNALARASGDQAKDVEGSTVRAAVLAKYPSLGKNKKK